MEEIFYQPFCQFDNKASEGINTVLNNRIIFNNARYNQLIKAWHAITYEMYGISCNISNQMQRASPYPTASPSSRSQYSPNLHKQNVRPYNQDINSPATAASPRDWLPLRLEQKQSFTEKVTRNRIYHRQQYLPNKISSQIEQDQKSTPHISNQRSEATIQNHIDRLFKSIIMNEVHTNSTSERQMHTRNHQINSVHARK